MKHIIELHVNTLFLLDEQCLDFLRVESREVDSVYIREIHLEISKKITSILVKRKELQYEFDNCWDQKDRNRIVRRKEKLKEVVLRLQQKHITRLNALLFRIKRSFSDAHFEECGYQMVWDQVKILKDQIEKSEAFLDKDSGQNVKPFLELL